MNCYGKSISIFKFIWLCQTEKNPLNFRCLRPEIIVYWMNKNSLLLHGDGILHKTKVQCDQTGTRRWYRNQFWNDCIKNVVNLLYMPVNVYNKKKCHISSFWMCGIRWNSNISCGDHVGWWLKIPLKYYKYCCPFKSKSQSDVIIEAHWI